MRSAAGTWRSRPRSPRCWTLRKRWRSWESRRSRTSNGTCCCHSWPKPRPIVNAYYCAPGLKAWSPTRSVIAMNLWPWQKRACRRRLWRLRHEMGQGVFPRAAVGTARAQVPDARAPRDVSARWAEYYAAVYQVPVELVAAIIDEESGWSPYAVSKKGAAGIMQLMSLIH